MIDKITAVVLVGGLGNRLRSMVSDRPKPMATVAAKPFLEYLLLQLRKNGIRDIVLCVGYLGECVQRRFGRGDPWDVNLCYSQEQELMGTGGALKLAERFLQEERFVVMNGDSFFDIDLKTLIEFHKDRQALGCVALSRVENTDRYGTVEIDRSGEILRFLEKAKGKGAGLVNGGIYVFDRQVLSLIPDGQAVSLEYDIFPMLIGKGFYGLLFEGYFADIGLPADYLKLQVDPSRLLAAVN